MTERPSGGDPVSEAYDRMAAEYDRRWDAYLTATVREAAARTDVHPGDRILDVGCGTGHLLEALAHGSKDPSSSGLDERRGTDPSSRGPLLAGVDLSGRMLRVARGKLPPRTLLVRARAGRLPFPAASFDLTVSSSSLHFWRRPEGALAEVARVLRPGGRLVLSDWCRDFWIQKVRQLYIGRIDPAHHRTYSTKELRELLEGAGLAVTGMDRYRARPTWGMMTARAVKPRSSV